MIMIYINIFFILYQMSLQIFIDIQRTRAWALKFLTTNMFEIWYMIENSSKHSITNLRWCPKHFSLTTTGFIKTIVRLTMATMHIYAYISLVFVLIHMTSVKSSGWSCFESFWRELGYENPKNWPEVRLRCNRRKYIW